MSRRKLPGGSTIRPVHKDLLSQFVGDLLIEDDTVAGLAWEA